MIRASSSGVDITPTLFPDGTSQVWKLSETILGAKSIEWRFEEERELIWVAQLAELLNHPTLYIPYLPYARQDKTVKNDLTFSLATFAKLLRHLPIGDIKSFDVHNFWRTRELMSDFENISPGAVHYQVIGKMKPDFIIFPDAGARTRYPHLWEMPSITFTKVRDQSTGVISKMATSDPKPKGRRGWIVDDICDGGATFIMVAKAMREIVPDCELHLFVSHGIFSKGKQILHDAGIVTIETTDSLPRNKEEAWKV